VLWPNTRDGKQRAFVWRTGAAGCGCELAARQSRGSGIVPLACGNGGAGPREHQNPDNSQSRKAQRDLTDNRRQRNNRGVDSA
jgi:hypothetical protein